MTTKKTIDETATLLYTFYSELLTKNSLEESDFREFLEILSQYIADISIIIPQNTLLDIDGTIISREIIPNVNFTDVN